MQLIAAKSYEILCIALADSAVPILFAATSPLNIPL